MKALSYAAIFGILGLFIGGMTGLGQTRYYKKSERDIALPVNVIGFYAFFAVAGMLYGLSVADSEAREKKLGINKISTEYYKNGRFWYAITAWVDPASGTNSSIVTKKNISGELQSNLIHGSKKDAVAHGIYSGSQKNVEKAHNIGTSYFFKALKETV